MKKRVGLYIIPIVCGSIVGLGLSFMTCLHWSKVGVIIVLTGLDLFLIRLAWTNHKFKKEKCG